MKPRSIAAMTTTAAVLAAGMSVVSAQQPPAPQSQPGAEASMAQQVTVTGCVQKESDYRRAHEAGVAGSGLGAGNEFVLTDVTASPVTPHPHTAAEPPAPTGTSGAKTPAYELTGPNEGQLAPHVGRRVEISGKLKAAETGPPIGVASAKQTFAGIEVASRDLKLRELEVTSVREAAGPCPAVR